MKHQEFHPDIEPVVAGEQEGITVDYKRVLNRALGLWYVVVISLLVALAIAFVHNRYATRVYPVNASIIIKEAKQTSGAELLYNNELIDPYRNYYNEVYIIKSYPLVESVLRDLNFGVRFYREGNIVTSEVYDYPIKVVILNPDEFKNGSFVINLINEKQVQLSRAGSTPETFAVGDTIQYEGMHAFLSLVDFKTVKLFQEVPIKLIYSDPYYLAGGFAAKISTEWAEKGSGVLKISTTGYIPAKEVDFINGLIRRYQQYDVDMKNEVATRTIDFINSQLDNISDSLRQVEDRVEAFKDRNVITNLSSEANRLYQVLEEVEASQVELSVRQEYYNYLIEYVQQGQDLDLVVLPSSAGISDGILGRLIDEMIQIQLDLKTAIGRERTDNPLTRQKRDRLNEIRKNIVESVDTQKNFDKIREEAIANRVQKLELQLDKLPGSERRFISIQRNYSLLENLYVFLMQKRSEASISRASTLSDIVVVNPPRAGGPISPKPGMNYLVAVLGGLGLPILVFVLLEVLNTRIQSKEDIEKIAKIPFIGGLGHKKTGDNRIVLSSPRSPVAESFRALRSNLSYFLKDKASPVILVSSSISGEGKSFTTINLASVLSLSGKRTLIVGADLRKPRMFSDFNLHNDVGLSNYLADLAAFDNVVQPTSEENLHMVSGGPVPPNPSELILGPRMADFIAEARKRYDYIIVDSPPMAIVADALVLAEHSDHMIFLVRQNYTPRHMLKSINEYYRNGRFKNLSIALNDIYKSGPGYGYSYTYGYNYGYGYGYGSNGVGKKKESGYYSDN